MTDPITAYLANGGMHVPQTRMSCHTTTATERPWLFQDRYRLRKHTPEPVDGAKECRAWGRHPDDLKRIQGNSCAGCERLPEDLK